METDKVKNAIEYAKNNPDSAYAVELRKRIESGRLDNSLHDAGFSQYATKPKQDGFVQAIAKDVVGTLVAKPAIRATEAITRIVAPNSMAAEGFGQMADRGESQTANIPLIGDIEVGQAKQFGEGGGRELASDTLKVGSFLFPYGKAAKAITGATGSKIAGNVASGVAGGYSADVGYNLADENKTLGESFTPGLGTALGAAIPLVAPVARGIKAATKSSKTAEGVTKRVIQGETKDIPLAEKAFSNIELGGIKTRGELSQRLQDAMERQMSVVDNELAKDTRALSLDNYAIRQTNNAGQEVKTDVISNALAHLEDFFTKAGDNVSASNIGLIRNKAVSEGLTHQEVNNIARMYAEEFGSKAFNKIGDPLTSVTAQMFENVRNGLKQAARGGLGFGEEAKVADRLYSAMNNTKRLIDKGVEGVNKLDGRLKQRNILQKLSNTAVKAMNSLTGGALKAGVEALGVSNVGNKIDNWIDLERSLQRDLEFIQKANTVKSENALIKLIEDYAKRLKFPGDKLIDDAQSRLTATKRIASNTKNITPSVSISDTIPQTSKKVKGETPSKLRKNSQAGFIATGFKNEGNLTTKILKDLEGKTTVSKQYILDATNRGELKQVERDITRQVLEDMTRNSDPLYDFKNAKGVFADEFKGKSEVMEAINDLGGEKKVRAGLLSLDDLKPTEVFDENNLGVQRALKEIKSGINTPLIVDEGLNIIDGNHRYVAQKMLGKMNVKVVAPKEIFPNSDTINVQEFADKVKSELLPLEAHTSGSSIKPNRTSADYRLSPRYENISLPAELRGKIKDYRERIYNSPIQTSAAKTHFGSAANDVTGKGYFGHTRIEDMADNKTRRVIEVQSDLYQKGNLEKEGMVKLSGLTDSQYAEMNKIKGIDEKNAYIKSIQGNLKDKVSKLQQYNDPTAHFRMIREEVKKAAQDGKTKLQFPTGETAMKIEGLGDNTQWSFRDDMLYTQKLTADKLQVGQEVQQGAGNELLQRHNLDDRGSWIITDVLGDGKFKAVPKSSFENLFEQNNIDVNSLTKNDLISYAENHFKYGMNNLTESFDISGKVDTNNPIYKFYEKDVQKYLNKFGGKRVVDDKGVSWIEIPITKEQGINPVDAFGKIQISPLYAGAGLSLAGVAGASAIKKRKK